MANSASKFYTVLVVGDNPQELMEKYKIGTKVEKYIKYKYLEAEKLQKNNIKILSSICKDYKSFNLTKYQVDILNERLKSIKNLTPFEFYQTITQGCTYDENGDAWCDVNPNGKFNTYQNGGHFSNPLVTNEGKETYSCSKKDVCWELVHKSNARLYELVWEMVFEGREPSNQQEEEILNNMKGKDTYFSNFKNKEEYVAYNSSYWNYAFLDEKGWKDVDDSGKEIEWVVNFYDKFIGKLKPNDRITIFEYCRNTDDE